MSSFITDSLKTLKSEEKLLFISSNLITILVFNPSRPFLYLFDLNQLTRKEEIEIITSTTPSKIIIPAESNKDTEGAEEAIPDSPLP